MKYLLLIIFLFVSIFPKQMLAQQKTQSCCLSEKDLIGTWQRNHKIVGSGLSQNFEFLSNGTFILNLGSISDDMRDIIQLKGKYRLDDDKLFFTIISKTILEGKIGITDSGINSNIFEIKEENKREILETNPIEIADPCYITLITRTNIKLGNEMYYKIK